MTIDQRNAQQIERAAAVLKHSLRQALLDNKAGATSVRVPHQFRGSGLVLGNIRKILENES